MDHDFLNVLRRNPTAIVGLGILIFFVLLATVGPLVVPLSKEQNPAMMYKPPSKEHWLGTDYAGRDVLMQIIHGAGPVMTVGFLTSLISVSIALVVGMVSGFMGGIVDTVLMRITDVFLTIPGLPLIIVLSMYVKATNPLVIALLLSVSAWGGLARAIRAQLLSLRRREFVEAASTLGLSNAYIMMQEIFPHIAPYVLMNLLLSFTGAIYAQVGLFFLGVLPFSSVNWGVMLNFAINQGGALYSRDSAFYLISPMAAIVLLQVGSILFIQVLDELYNPRLRDQVSTVEAPSAVRVNDLEQEAAIPSKALVEVKDLSVIYPTRRGDLLAVDSADFYIREREAYGIVGESGSGKSTLAYTLLNLLPPPGRVLKGDVCIDGKSILAASGESLRLRRWTEVAMVFQGSQNTLNPVTSISKQFLQTGEAHGDISETEIMGKTKELLELVRLNPEEVLGSYAHELSGGMKQRVAIAMSLLLDPRVLILDEPTTALDVLNQRVILDILRDIREERNQTMLFITHDLSIITEIADRLAIMYAGMIVEEGPLEQVFSKPLHPYTSGLLNAVPSIIADTTAVQSIPGAPPDGYDLPTGCRFAPRCSLAEKRCEQEEPLLTKVGAQRRVACHRWKEIYTDEESLTPATV